MKTFLILAAVFASQFSLAADVGSSKKREVASAADCQVPLKDYRAFVIVGVSSGNDKEGAELLAPNGARSEFLDCTTNRLSTIDVLADGKGQRVNFSFSDKNACTAAFRKIGSATKDLPAVIVIDRDCRAHLTK